MARGLTRGVAAPSGRRSVRGAAWWPLLLLLLFLRCADAASVPFHPWSSPAEVHLRTSSGSAAASWRGVEASADVEGTAVAGAGGVPGRGGRRMQLLPSLLTAAEVEALHAAALRCGAYGTEADSVDRAPTHQAYVFEDGKPTVGAAEVARLLRPILEERLLPYVRARYDCAHACVADVILRRYRPAERTRLGLHYDVEAFATAILPLSAQRAEGAGVEGAGAEGAGADGAGADGAAEPALSPRSSSGLSSYSGGLFVQGGASRASRRLVRFEAPGDVLVHQFDLQHGVEVEDGERYALAIWFADAPQSRARGTAPWVARAAAAGNADAQFLLATFCAQGRFGHRRDDDAAAEWLARGAAQGHAVSVLGLGRHHLGRGEEAEAASCFLRAAQAGHVEAQYSAGICLLEAKGVARDVAEAAKWLREAAAQSGEYAEAAAAELEELREVVVHADVVAAVERGTS